MSERSKEWDKLDAEKQRFARGIAEAIKDYNELPEWIRKLVEKNRSNDQMENK